MYTCVLFDMDGTLVDSYPGIYHCYEQTMKKMGRSFEKDVFVGKAIGAPLPEVFREMCGMNAEEVREAVTYYRACYDQRGKMLAEPYDGMIQTLQQLKANGCFLGVATMKKERFAEEILERLSIRHYFDAVCGADEGDVLSKADLIQKCLDIAGWDPEDAILVGDSPYDAEGAEKAGIDFLAVLYGFGFRDEKELSKVRYQGAVSTANDVGRWICRRIREGENR